MSYVKASFTSVRLFLFPVSKELVVLKSLGKKKLWHTNSFLLCIMSWHIGKQCRLWVVKWTWERALSSYTSIPSFHQEHLHSFTLWTKKPCLLLGSSVRKVVWVVPPNPMCSTLTADNPLLSGSVSFLSLEEVGVCLNVFLHHT